MKETGKVFGVLQRVGRAFMLPIAVLPVAGLLLGIGRSLTNETMLRAQYEMFPRLGERRQQDAGTLSGGEQQMLAICRGLMSKPKILMLDEPSLGLAPVVVNDVFRNIQRIRDEGVTVILVEQNAKKSLSICNYAYVIETGHVVMSGTGEEMLRNPEVAAAYLGSTRT